MSPQLLVPARAVDDLAGRDLLQVLAVDRLTVGPSGLLQPGSGDSVVLPGDSLGHGQVLRILLYAITTKRKRDNDAAHRKTRKKGKENIKTGETRRS